VLSPRESSVKCTLAPLSIPRGAVQGVNLPAHLVIIKGTQRYVSGEAGRGSSGYQEYERGECLQMIGRAGALR
jgi:replicative superfamily II helicase